jgi:dihydrofolate reductase
MKDLYMIACVSKDGGLGKDGGLLWHIPEDMKFFRETTTGSTVIMGRKTFESIGRALPGRRNIVLSSRKGENADVEWCTREELEDTLKTVSGKKFVIGGASLYEMFLPEAEKIYLTEVDDMKPADTMFPEFDKSKWRREIIQDGEHDGAKYEIVEYTRR